VAQTEAKQEERPDKDDRGLKPTAEGLPDLDDRSSSNRKAG
jgi:hypothetical protein